MGKKKLRGTKISPQAVFSASTETYGNEKDEKRIQHLNKEQTHTIPEVPETDHLGTLWAFFEKHLKPGGAKSTD